LRRPTGRLRGDLPVDSTSMSPISLTMLAVK